MATLTEIVATVVVHSSAAALSHFGVTLAPAEVVQPAPTPPMDRVIARSPRAAEKLVTCNKPRSTASAVRA